MTRVEPSSQGQPAAESEELDYSWTRSAFRVAGGASIPETHGHRDPLVSIVTPAYNEERYLRQCIESILAQTYQNWDYLIVDNHSNDATLEIASEYSRRDWRIRVQSNDAVVPVMVNFNTAFRNIATEAKYCKVVGGDDWIYPQCLERLVTVAERNPTACIVASYGIYGSRIETAGPPFPVEVVPGKEACRRYLTGSPYFFATPTTLLYRADIVRSRAAFFREDCLHADLAACFEFLETADLAFCHEVLTFNREREGSLTSTAQLYNRFILEHLAMLEEYGRVYLAEPDLTRQIRWKSAALYKRLGERLWRGVDQDFWAAQQRQLAAFGHRMNRTRIGVHAALCLIETAIGRLRW